MTLYSFACAPGARASRILSSLACAALLIAVGALQAATPGGPTLTTSSLPAGLRASIHRTIDGAGWVQTQQVTEADPAFDPEFGYAVALHGTTAMIGAQQARIDGNDGQGAVYVFEQVGGTWTRTQKLVSDDGQAFDTFGHSIVFEGDTALIGAYGAMVDDNFSQGAVYVFTRIDGTWTQTQKITVTGGQMFDNFGYSIALQGTTAIIGADGATVDGHDFQGAAYVFDGSSGTWTQTQRLSADDGAIGDIFGYSVALDGTRAMIGAYANNGYQGAVYVFGESGGSWAQSQKLVASDGAPNTYFGYATALSGSTLLVGSWGANPGGADTQGAAYVFTESNGTWTQTQQLVGDDGAAGDRFGHSVALQGTTALIGADGWTATSNGGAVYVFDGTGGSFVQAQRFVAGDRAPGNQFGLPVTLDGATALVGAWLWVSPESTMPGAAYFFELNGTPPTTYTIGGTVSGLLGSGLELRQDGADPLAVATDGSFTFATPIADGATYSVTVSVQPGAPSQTCSVTNGSGTVAAANIDDVVVTCTTNVVDVIFADGFEGGAHGPTTLAQTSDTTPVAQNSVACGNSGQGTTADNQYWRRYDFSEHAVTTAANVGSVDVSVEQTTGAPDLTVTLYTIPHSVTVDTIDVGQLTQIGQTVVAAPADATLTSLNVPVSGTVVDTVASDLVVEVSTADGSADGTAFYIGSTPAAETHASFISSTACNIATPTPTADIGAPDMHVIEAVHITD